MRIGTVAGAAAVSVDTLRYYEREGLIARPRRKVSGYRDYAGDVLERLEFIRDAKQLGFSLREIKELLSAGVKSTRECGPVTRKAEAKLAAMNAEIARLSRMRRMLARIIAECTSMCECAECSAAPASRHARIRHRDSTEV
jgi:DNA-binding transcriptional MerR regulator